MAISKGDKVLVRDHMAGVHVGTLEALDPAAKTCELADCRKIWYWTGAASVHGIAAHGLSHAESKVAPLVEHIVTCNVVEVVKCTDDGFSCVMGAPEWTA